MVRRNPPLAPELNALRYRAIGCAYRVHTALGPAMKEHYYQRALAHALRREGFHVDERVPIRVEFEGLDLGEALEMDLVVDNLILLELKARDTPLAVWNSQVLSYLEHSGLPLGYLINFHVPHLRQGMTPFVNFPDWGGPQRYRPPSTLIP